MCHQDPLEHQLCKLDKLVSLQSRAPRNLCDNDAYKGSSLCHLLYCSSPGKSCIACPRHSLCLLLEEKHQLTMPVMDLKLESASAPIPIALHKKRLLVEHHRYRRYHRYLNTQDRCLIVLEQSDTHTLYIADAVCCNTKSKADNRLLMDAVRNDHIKSKVDGPHERQLP